METIQLIKITPRQLKEQFSEVVQNQIDELRKYLESKEPTEYLTRQEVAKLLKINMATLTSWTHKGLLKGYFIDNSVYYKRHEIDDALELK